jgi:hypothetical protein
VKNRGSTSTHKKVVIEALDHAILRGYLNPARLGRDDSLDLLTPEGEHLSLPLKEIKCVYFVREFTEHFELERKAFLSRPKLDGLWVRMRFKDQDALEGIVPNDLLDLLDRGVHLTPPDLHGESLRLFVPRTALTELTVLGVVGVARRGPRRPELAEAGRQTKLFSE